MNGVPLRHSLRVRLPLFISTVIVAVLGAFLWTMNRALEHALLETGAARAQAAASELATVLTASAARGTNEARRLAANDAIRQYLRAPSEEQEPVIRALLRPIATPGQPPVLLVDAAGRGVLEVAPAAGPRVTLPRASDAPLAAEGLTPLRNVNGMVAYDLVADVGSKPRLGALVVPRTLSAAQTTDTINRLVGREALVAVGNRRGDVWSNFSKPLPAPPIDADRAGTTEYRRADGDRRIGAAALVAGTPWTIWIEFPRAMLLAPARVMLRRMLALSLLIVALAAAAVAFITTRITTPLHELTTASADVAGGQVSRLVQATRSDEIGRLGAAFNEMAQSVETARQDLESRVRRRTASLSEANAALKATNDELESFSYSVSHDLRAPLRHVAGFAALLEQSAGARLDDASRRYVRMIADAATRMGRLIDDLLAFSRVARAELMTAPVALNDLVRDVQREVTNGTAPEKLVWHIGDLPAVAGDRALLRLAFVNLLSNAVKYSSTRDRAEIEIGAAGGDAGQTTVFVRDNGVGFDMAYAHKLFGVFQRLHAADEFEGTGIGLANVRRIVERHGGRVWAESQVGAGATFYVSLPREVALT